MHRAGTGCRFVTEPLLLFGMQDALLPPLLAPGRYASGQCSPNIRQQWFLSAHLDGFPVLRDPEPHQGGSTAAMRLRGTYTPSTARGVGDQPVLFPGGQLAAQSALLHG